MRDVKYKTDSDTKVLLYFDEELNKTSDDYGFKWDCYNLPNIDTTNAKFDRALQLNKSYVISENGITLGGKDFTIDFWSYMDSTTAINGAFFELYSTVNDRITLQRNSTAKQIRLRVGSTNYASDTLTSATDNTLVNVLNHYAVVYTHSSSNIKVYVNGIEKITMTRSITETEYSNIILGYSIADNNGYLNLSGNFIGSISEFRISDGIARWSSDFSSNLPTTVYTRDNYTKLLLHFDNDDIISSSIIKDEYDNKWMIKSPDTTSLSTDSKLGKSLNCNSQSGCIVMVDPITLFDSDFTIDFYYKYTTINTNTTVLLSTSMVSATTKTATINIALNANKKPCILVNGSEKPASASNTNVALASNTWNHLAFVYYKEFNKIGCWLNGIYKSSISIGTLNVGEGTFLGINGTSSKGTTDGCIGYYDNFRISKCARWDEGIDFHTSTLYESNGVYKGGYILDNNTKSLIHFDNDVVVDEVVENNWSIVGNPLYTEVNKAFETGFILDGYSYIVSNPIKSIIKTVDFRMKLGNNFDKVTIVQIVSEKLDSSLVIPAPTVYLQLSYNYNTDEFTLVYNGNVYSWYNNNKYYLNKLIHVAIVSYNSNNTNSILVYFDGESQFKITGYMLNNESSYIVYLGSDYNSNSNLMIGSIDEFRISDINRWNNDFDPYGIYDGSFDFDALAYRSLETDTNTLSLIRFNRADFISSDPSSITTADRIIDQADKSNAYTINGSLNSNISNSIDIYKTGDGSLKITGSGSVSKDNALTNLYDNGDFTIDFWMYPIGKGSIYNKPNLWCIEGKSDGLTTNTTATAIFGDIEEGTQTNGYATSAMKVNTLYLFRNAQLNTSSHVLDSTQIILTDPIIYFNTWCHIAITYEDKDKKFSIFKNGIKIGEKISTVDPRKFVKVYEDHTLYIGRDFNGCIDEFRVSNICRWTENFDINQIFQRRKTKRLIYKSDSIVEEDVFPTKFKKESSSASLLWFDNSTYIFRDECLSSTWTNTDKKLFTIDTISNKKALTWDFTIFNENIYYKLPGSNNNKSMFTNTDSFTVEAWVYFKNINNITSAGNKQNISLFEITSTQNNRIQIGITYDNETLKKYIYYIELDLEPYTSNASDEIYPIYCNAVTGTVNIDTTVNINTNSDEYKQATDVNYRWTHLAIVYNKDASTLRFFIDGYLMQAVKCRSVFPSNVNVSLGQDYSKLNYTVTFPDINHGNFYIDQIRMSKEAKYIGNFVINTAYDPNRQETTQQSSSSDPSTNTFPEKFVYDSSTAIHLLYFDNEEYIFRDECNRSTWSDSTTNKAFIISEIEDIKAVTYDFSVRDSQTTINRIGNVGSIPNTSSFTIEAWVYAKDISTKYRVNGNETYLDIPIFSIYSNYNSKPVEALGYILHYDRNNGIYNYDMHTKLSPAIINNNTYVLAYAVESGFNYKLRKDDSIIIDKDNNSYNQAMDIENRWVHIAIVYNKDTNKVSTYIDGYKIWKDIVLTKNWYSNLTLNFGYGTIGLDSTTTSDFSNNNFNGGVYVDQLLVSNYVKYTDNFTINPNYESSGLVVNTHKLYYIDFDMKKNIY